jgi:hypothetical protein
VSNVSEANQARKVTIAARVPPALAEAVAALADAGDRTRSREVLRAIESHVERSAMGGSFVAPNGAAMGRSNVVGDPAERATGPRPALFPASFDPSRRGKWTVPSSGGK